MSQMFLNVVSTFKGDGIQRATKQLGAFGKQTSSFGSMLGKVGGALAAFGVATKAVQFGRESIVAARDLERNLFALNTVFDELSPGMNQFAKDAENLGLSQAKAAKASVFIGSVLKQSGFAMEDVAKETKNLVTLGTDLAALYGYDVQEALLGMTALFRGEYDPIEKFGVAMKQSEINAELAARGQDKLEGAARRNAEQTVRLELLYERAADAMGAFTGQSGSLYTEQKKLGATFENMQAQLGTALLPAVSDINEELRTLLNDITPFLIAAFENIAAALEGVLGIFTDALDPTTELGESIAALNIQAESLGETLTGEEFDFDVFNIAASIITTVVNALHDLMRAAEEVIIHLQVAGIAINDFFFNREKFNNTDYVAMREEMIAIAHGAKDIRLNTATATKSTKKMLSSVERADKAKLERLRNQVKKVAISANYATNELRRMRMQAGLAAEGDTKTDVKDKDVQTDSPSGSRGETAAEKAARQEKERLAKRAAAFKSFEEAVKQTFSSIKNSIMSSFELPSLGNSVNSITKNIAKLLEKTKKFASNITQLASMGLDPALLQQVIQAGPIAGAQLAASLVAGGAGAIAGINTSFGEFGNLASQIAGVGTGAMFGTAQTVNNYSVSVTGGVATSADVGRAVVNAIASFERQSGAAWRA
jgi:hypothetical protein